MACQKRQATKVLDITLAKKLALLSKYPEQNDKSYGQNIFRISSESSGALKQQITQGRSF
jgi:hypothetical protein